MIHVFYRYNAPPAAEPKLHCQTVPLKDAAPLLETLKPIASEILVEHVTLDQLRNVKRPAPTPNAVRIK
jgi:hypothetical protein